MRCEYCKEEMEDKGYKADGKRYHLKCVRKFRKEIDRQKRNKGIEVGKLNNIQINNC